MISPTADGHYFLVYTNSLQYLVALTLAQYKLCQFLCFYKAAEMPFFVLGIVSDFISRARIEMVISERIWTNYSFG